MNFKGLMGGRRRSMMDAMSWSAYVLEAVGKAKKYGKPVHLYDGRCFNADGYEWRICALESRS